MARWFGNDMFKGRKSAMFTIDPKKWGSIIAIPIDELKRAIKDLEK